MFEPARASKLAKLFIILLKKNTGKPSSMVCSASKARKEQPVIVVESPRATASHSLRTDADSLESLGSKDYRACHLAVVP